ncbi:MAG: 2'-5' RNA ligase family protein [bacterium]|nr:2'-5' RNA ligase family protein [bacterium]
MLLDIIILPPAEIRKAIGRLSGEISRRHSLAWKVDDKKLIPHISLYHLNCSPQRIPEITKYLKILASETRPVRLAIEKGSYDGPYFGMNVSMSNLLSDLHHAVVYGVKHLRSFGMPLFFLPTKKLQKKYYKNFGVFKILKYFSPHITIGMVKNTGDLPKIVKLVRLPKFATFNGKQLALAEIDKRWQVTKILKTFKLQ